MKYDWITKAIENKGFLTTSQNSHGIYSTMHFKGEIAIVGDHHSTLPDALTSLNSALQEDWVEDDSPIANVKAHAPLSAGASVEHGVGGVDTKGSLNRTADRGCHGASCSLLFIPLGTLDAPSASLLVVAGVVMAVIVTVCLGVKYWKNAMALSILSLWVSALAMALNVTAIYRIHQQREKVRKYQSPPYSAPANDDPHRAIPSDDAPRLYLPSSGRIHPSHRGELRTPYALELSQACFSVSPQAQDVTSLCKHHSMTEPVVSLDRILISSTQRYPTETGSVSPMQTKPTSNPKTNLHGGSPLG